jgi:hypothetical protein
LHRRQLLGSLILSSIDALAALIPLVSDSAGRITPILCAPILCSRALPKATDTRKATDATGIGRLNPKASAGSTARHRTKNGDEATIHALLCEGVSH